MAEINDVVLTDVYREYLEALHTRGKTETLYSGIKKIFFKLNRYVNDPPRFKERSEVALLELESLLNRFYFHDKEFIEKLIYEAKAYIIELLPES